jgi:hypothetical protein
VGSRFGALANNSLVLGRGASTGAGFGAGGGVRFGALGFGAGGGARFGALGFGALGPERSRPTRGPSP